MRSCVPWYTKFSVHRNINNIVKSPVRKRIKAAQTKVTIGNENFIIVPNITCLNFQVHVTREHIDASSHTVINLTKCVTESVLIALDIFPYHCPLFDLLYLQNYSKMLIVQSEHWPYLQLC